MLYIKSGGNPFVFLNFKVEVQIMDYYFLVIVLYLFLLEATMCEISELFVGHILVSCIVT